ncbi:Gfo/Idh/MocA family oxidoreductase [Prosthecobacter sp.]|uniref:Gfo/Idh/MocA family protein n=1 Tax=Prosthecobacter sp. TaxID=1965333 RepID=UPI0024889577|nr:Gfo/Idh/MocA family oxidoreductase [Prosthecobacter sp.]MDI1314531.1 Gfo/Idh/MocA family oxidoreductase [Prosthecobacter sp.]
MNTPTPPTRRHFLKTAAATVATFNIVPRHVLGGPRFVPPSEKLNVAIIGTGGQGRSNVRALMQLDDAQIIAVADPAESFSLENFYFKGMGGRLPVKAEIEKHYSTKTPNFRCSDYVDFRDMLEQEKSIDAVLIATPDHLHAYASVIAMRAGKHVYCEKPLTHNIWEARHVAKVAAETGVATQLGSQGHSSLGTRETIEYIQDGAIGAVKEIHVWVGAKRWNPTLLSKPTDTPPVPAGLNWDLWLGPRNERAFNPAYFPVAWRDFWDFGSTGIGDFACHDMNSAVRALDLPIPSRVEAHAAGMMDSEIAPHGSVIYYTFPAAGARPEIRMTWHDGGLMPEAPAALGNFPLPKRGCLFIGEKGVIQCDGGGGAPRLFPDARRAEYTKPAPKLKRSNGHHRDWVDACKGGDPATSPFAYAAHLTEIALLGVLSLRTQKPIEWDAPAMKAKGLPAADAFIKETYRKGWEVV